MSLKQLKIIKKEVFIHLIKKTTYSPNRKIMKTKSIYKPNIQFGVSNYICAIENTYYNYNNIIEEDWKFEISGIIEIENK